MIEKYVKDISRKFIKKIYYLKLVFFVFGNEEV